ncbi:hypothetical protein JCM10207_004859 [Rhodosporidiobolus poonsookiae]
MSADAPVDRLSALPVDLLQDVLLPSFAPHDLVNLSATCKAWHAFLTAEGGPCEILWQRKTASDFHFPIGASGRRSGFFALYSRLAQSSAYVWGQNSNGRLGLPDDPFRLPAPLRSRLLAGGLPLPTRLELPAPPVALVAGGWSFHALTADGEVVSWGQLEAENAHGTEQAPLHYAGRILRPSVLPQMGQIGEVVQLEAGRKHILLLGKDGKVWELHSYGRAVEVRDEGERWGAAARFGEGGNVLNAVKAVQAGWDYSTVLTQGGDVYTWWQPGRGVLKTKAAEAGENDLDPSTHGVGFSLSLDTLRLPSLPASDDFPDDKIDRVACGDNFIIALTVHSQLYHLNLADSRPFGGQGGQGDDDSPTRSRESRARLEAEFLDGRRAWKHMKRFCDMGEVGQLDGFKEKGLAPGTRITHISAQFRSFAAYSVPATSDSSGSIVLFGDERWNENKAPTVIPALQGRGVIKVAHGDWHNLALTSDGQLLSWGSFSAGALGLGHPQLSGTPLSAPYPPPAPPAEQPAQPPPLPGLPGAFPPAQRQPPALFPGFLPPRPIVRPPPPPQKVDNPTRIRFAGEEDAPAEGSSSEQRRKYVYAVAAGGWHSGCLAVDLSPRSALSSREEEPLIPLPRSAEDEAQAEMRRLGQRADEESLNGDRSWMGRLGRSFRVGLPGAGARDEGASRGRQT